MDCLTDQQNVDRASAATVATRVDAESPARSDWSREEIAALFAVSFLDLVFDAARVHQARHARNRVQLSTLLSVKTGGCPEDCGYCSQSFVARDGMKPTKLMAVEDVIAAAKAAVASGSTRFCMGAAWRSPKDRDMDAVCAMVREVKALGFETCMTLGMLSEGQARRLAEAGLDYYNHNIDTSPENYSSIVSTRSFDDRLATLACVRDAGISVCCGGILGLGEERSDRVGLVHALATLPCHPASVPLNMLVPVVGTAAGDRVTSERGRFDEIEFVRTIAVCRITMPDTVIRLSAGRESMTDAMQALCFLAGAASVFSGDTLLTTPNAGADADAVLFRRLGLEPARHEKEAYREGELPCSKVF